MAAARLQQLLQRARGLAEPAIRTVQSQTVKQYEAIMAQNSEYVVKDKAQADKLLRQWFFTQLARIPSGVAHAQEEAGVLRQRLALGRELPVPEMATYLGFAAELYAWFVIGEIIGRGGSLTGYNV